MRYLALLYLFSSVLAFGQQTTGTTPEVPPAPANAPSTPVSLVQSPEGNPNLLNLSVGGAFVYDDNTLGGYKGGDVDWGAIIDHRLEGGSLSLNYRGDYRDYNGVQGYSGTDQFLAFALQKALNRRWSITISESGGIYLYGASYFSLQPLQTNALQVNPYSFRTEFSSSAFSATYQKSLRLSYTGSVSYFLSRYSGNSPFGMTGVSASGSVAYRITARTTLSGTYSFSDFQYQNLGGTAQIHTGYATLSHQFRNRWNILGSAGVSRSESSGTINLALSPILAQLLGTSYVTGHYDTATIFPYFQASASRQVSRHTSVSISGGQSVSPGNGVYLASKALNASGYFSYTWRLASIGFGGTYNRYGSVSNSAQAYRTAGFSASYGYPLTQHIGLNLRYDFIDYSTPGATINSVSPFDRDNRFTVGVAWNSKAVPITLF